MVPAYKQIIEMFLLLRYCNCLHGFVVFNWGTNEQTTDRHTHKQTHTRTETDRQTDGSTVNDTTDINDKLNMQLNFVFLDQSETKIFRSSTIYMTHQHVTTYLILVTHIKRVHENWCWQRQWYNINRRQCSGLGVPPGHRGRSFTEVWSKNYLPGLWVMHV